MPDITCPDCERSVDERVAPFHALGHRLDKAVADSETRLKAHVEAAIAAVPKPKDPPAPPDLEAALKPIKDKIAEMDVTPSPEQVRAHVKDCPTCAAAWKGHLAEPTIKKDTPAAPPTPAKRKLFNEADLPASPLRLKGAGIVREYTEAGIALRVADEATAKAAAQVVPNCQWIADEHGGYYACEKS